MLVGLFLLIKHRDISIVFTIDVIYSGEMTLQLFEIVLLKASN